MPHSVSIIVPIYGTEPYIAECARSVLGQSWPYTEFIFVDDGSPDRAVEVLQGVIDKEFPEKKPQIKLIRKPNGGLPQARKSGLDVATGDYIMHVDSDDWVDTDAAEKLAIKAEQTGADVVYFYLQKHKSGGRSHITRDPLFASPRDYAADILHFGRAHGYLCNKFIKRELYRADLFYPTVTMHEDMVLSSQLLYYASSAVLLPEPLYHYRRTNPNAQTRKSRRFRRAASARTYLDLYEFYRGKRPSPVAAHEQYILDRCAWIGIRWDRSLLKERPYLVKDSSWWLRLAIKLFFPYICNHTKD